VTSSPTDQTSDKAPAADAVAGSVDKVLSDPTLNTDARNRLQAAVSSGDDQLLIDAVRLVLLDVEQGTISLTPEQKADLSAALAAAGVPGAVTSPPTTASDDDDSFPLWAIIVTASGACLFLTCCCGWLAYRLTKKKSRENLPNFHDGSGQRGNGSEQALLGSPDGEERKTSKVRLELEPDDNDTPRSPSIAVVNVAAAGGAEHPLSSQGSGRIIRGGTTDGALSHSLRNNGGRVSRQPLLRYQSVGTGRPRLKLPPELAHDIATPFTDPALFERAAGVSSVSVGRGTNLSSGLTSEAQDYYSRSGNFPRTHLV